MCVCIRIQKTLVIAKFAEQENLFVISSTLSKAELVCFVHCIP